MSKIDEYGDLVENELWGSNSSDVDEDDVFEDGEQCYLDGGIPDDNPWPKDTYGYNTWLDGFWSAS